MTDHVNEVIFYLSTITDYLVKIEKKLNPTKTNKKVGKRYHKLEDRESNWNEIESNFNCVFDIKEPKDYYRKMDKEDFKMIQFFVRYGIKNGYRIGSAINKSPGSIYSLIRRIGGAAKFAALDLDTPSGNSLSA